MAKMTVLILSEVYNEYTHDLSWMSNIQRCGGVGARCVHFALMV